MRNLRYALRSLTARWGVSLVAVFVMSLGISLTASMYAIIDGIVLSGPDYVAIDEIVHLQTTIPQSQFDQPVRIHDYLDWREQQSVFSHMAAYSGTGVSISGDGSRAETFSAARISASTLALLGVTPFMGRGFSDEDDFRTDLDIVILAYHVWANRFDGDPGIIGRTIRLNARPTTVIGVMPEGFRFPEMHDMWLPLNIDPGLVERGEGPGLNVLGRLGSGSTEEEARSQLTAIAARLEQQYPDSNREIVPVVEMWREAAFVDAETKGLLYTMFVAVIGVLMIACANVANLLFATTIGRSKELAVRTAMGASRTRVLAQLLGEAVLLAAGGAILGIVLSWFSLDMFSRVVAELSPPPWMVFELNAGVLGFVIAITFAAALASGVLPAIYATRSDVHSILQDQSRGTSSRAANRWSTLLVSLEVALSCALLVGAGLMVRSTIAVGNADFGVDTDGILTARFNLPPETYPDSLAVREATELILAELKGIPGVTEAALSSSLPVMGTSLRFYGVRDRQYSGEGEFSFGGYTFVSPDFFEMLGVTVVAGRTFEDTDVMDSDRLMVVDQRFADLNWPGQDPLGRQVRLGRLDSDRPWHTVVGVVESLEMLQPLQFGADPPEGMFVPLSQQPATGLAIMLRGDGDPGSLAQPVRDLIMRVDPDIPVRLVDALDARVEDQSLDIRIIGGMFATFGIVALILASVGLYAVMAFSVSRRKTEVGIRMALGAHRGRIVRLVLSQGARPLVGGLAVGMLLAFGLGKALATFLFNVGSLDPVTFIGVPMLMVVVSVLALIVPAGRASRVPPVAALREE
jgi:putative ABC transport system permease protein